MRKIKIAIIGSEGYVGKAYVDFFKDHYKLVKYDPALGDKNATREEVNECHMSVVCVPTQMNEDKTCNTSIVEDTIKWLETSLIMIKSTVEPETTRRLREETGKRIVFSPEYVGEGSYTIPFWKYPHPTDVKWHNFMIVGGDKKDTDEVISICQRILGPDCRYHQTDSTTAEVVKYGENSWGATKVTFFNEWYEICKVFGVNFKEWRELLLLDERVERIHTAVFEDARGFGGKCFPKDVNAIVAICKKLGYIPKLLLQVLKSNEEFKKLSVKGLKQDKDK